MPSNQDVSEIKAHLMGSLTQSDSLRRTLWIKFFKKGGTWASKQPNVPLQKGGTWASKQLNVPLQKGGTSRK